MRFLISFYLISECFFAFTFSCSNTSFKPKKKTNCYRHDNNIKNRENDYNTNSFLLTPTWSHYPSIKRNQKNESKKLAKVSRKRKSFLWIFSVFAKISIFVPAKFTQNWKCKNYRPFSIGSRNRNCRSLRIKKKNNLCFKKINHNENKNDFFLWIY